MNRNPASPYFGRIYVSVTTAAINAASGRPLGKGIYVLNPDQTDALGQGNTPLTGGLPFASGAESPHRVVIGPDDNLYICDWSDATGTLYVTDPNVGTNSSAKIVLSGQGGPFPLTTSRTHGSIGAAWIDGSLGEGNLNVWVIDEDLQTDRTTTSKTELNSVWQWTIGSGPLPFTGTAAKFGATQPLLGIASQLADIVRGRDGKWYISQKRDDNATTTGIFVRSSDNSTTLWSSLTATRTMLNNGSAFDLLSSTAAIDISADGKYLIALKQNTNSISILPLTDGIPDLTNRIVLPTFPTTGNGRDVSFDAAGNICSVSSGQALLRIYSAGGTTVAATDGSFGVFRPPSVGAVVLDNLGSEEGSDPVSFNIYRTGDTSRDLTVVYTLTGTAVNGVDYAADPLSAVIPAGQTNVIVTLTPIDDHESEPVETVILSVVGSTSFEYDLAASSGGTARILDNDLPMISIVGIKTNVYESLPRDAATFALRRIGNTNVDVNVIYHYDGTAVPFVDFTDDNFTLVTFPAGSIARP